MQSRAIITLFMTMLCLAHSGVYCRAHENPVSGGLLTSFEHISTPNFGVINCIARDDRGFIWFGTSKGLYTYDGYQVRVLTVGNSRPLEGNIAGHDRQVVTAISKTANGFLLLGTDLGPCLFDPLREAFVPIDADVRLAHTRVTAMTPESDSTFLIGTTTEGIFRVNVDRRTVAHPASLNHVTNLRINVLLFDSKHTLWIGTPGEGLYGIEDPGQHPRIGMHLHRRTPEPMKLPSDEVTALCEYADRDLWIGTDRGLVIFDRMTGRVRHPDIPSPTPFTVRSLAADRMGHIWIAASEAGLFYYSDGIYHRFTPANDPERSLYTIEVVYPDPAASDSTGTFLWIGTRIGIDKVVVSKAPFMNFIRGAHSLRLNRGAVISLCEDHAGTLWAGLWGGGLNGFARTGGAYHRTATMTADQSGREQLPNNNVNALIEDHSGNLWIGTSEGLAMLDSGRDRSILDRHSDGNSTSLAGNTVENIFCDRMGRVWICTNGGLSLLLPGAPHRFRNYLQDPNDARRFGGNMVSDIIEDRRGRLWIATYGRGLNRLDPDNAMTRYTDPRDSASDQDNFIYALAEDSAGLFWLSTRAGLTSFDPSSGTFRRLPVDELHGAHIHDILPDQRTGDLWLSTSIGLARFNTRSGDCTRIESEHGLQFSELFSGFCRTRSGTYIAGGIDGFTEFSPGDLEPPVSSPSIALTSFRASDAEILKSAPDLGEVRLPHDRNFVSFSFVVLDYRNPLANAFKYRLSGIDHDWVRAGTRNFVTYSNLAPGRYTFEVMGRNSDHVWSRRNATLTFIISPPYWETWWFRALVAGLIGAMMYALYRYRVQHLLELERLRLRIADDLHDDIGSNLSAIAIASRSLLRMPELGPAIRQKATDIYETALASSEGIRDIVWLIQPRYDTVDDLVLRIKDTASVLLADIHHTFQTAGVVNPAHIGIAFKRSFYLAAKEILANVVRHAGAASVRIQVEQTDGQLTLIVQDDGKGFDRDAAGAARQGNGLCSLRDRARAIGGTLHVESGPGGGTTVQFTGKL